MHFNYVYEILHKYEGHTVLHIRWQLARREKQSDWKGEELLANLLLHVDLRWLQC